MNKFLIKIVIFSIIPFFYFGIIGLINLKIINSGTPQVKQAKILIIGDSHPQKALIPNVFRSAVNIAQSAEPYLLTFWKLKKILPLVNADTVIIGFSHHNISSFNNHKFNDIKWSSELFNRSYTINEFSTMHNHKINYHEYYRILWRQLCLFPHNNHYNYIEDYKNTTESNLSDSLKTIQRHYFYKGRPVSYSNESIAYLDSILHFCLKQNTIPILTYTPVHEVYLKLIPDEIKTHFNVLKKKYQQKGFLVVDYSNQINIDSLFLNIDHLNQYGAKVFSEKMKEDLNII
mgnify:CR=1 FL=1